MKKTAIALSIVFLIGGFLGIWMGSNLGSVMCFTISLGWVGFMSMLSSAEKNG